MSNDDLFPVQITTTDGTEYRLALGHGAIRRLEDWVRVGPGQAVTLQAPIWGERGPGGTFRLTLRRDAVATVEASVAE